MLREFPSLRAMFATSLRWTGVNSCPLAFSSWIKVPACASQRTLTFETSPADLRFQ